ncbi:hypothetical protein M2139_001473 [Enterococcus sp. PF1-24]|uniref:hypothetical protein n=1 Tax=unclassified Enterococcus TaxID=2608891 RepID=UPI002476DEBE|nr:MULTISPECIES: hypothetical protein [unclassified Enterococcus]MDH6364536.1 hypothetical protein [Enterococcus sp. PFB1-1]MDH6401587.1 hypothetical protein [Enterococcus sp. PF1-24]
MSRTYWERICAMLEKEGFKAKDFRICEIPINGVFCCERITDYYGIDYFVVEETVSGVLVPTYVSHKLDENGHNNFVAKSIQDSIALNGIYSDEHTFTCSQTTENSVFIKNTTLVDVVKKVRKEVDEGKYFSNSEKRFYDRLISFIKDKGGFVTADWELEEIAYLKQEIHYSVHNIVDNKRFVIIYKTNLDKFTLGYFGIERKLMEAKNIKEALEKCFN